MAVQSNSEVSTSPFLRGLTNSLLEDSAIVKQPSTHGKLVTGDATANLAALQAVSDGEFSISINGVSEDILGLDFTGLTFNQMAEAMQAAIDALVPGVLVTVDSGVFTITSPTVGASSTVSFLTAVSGGGGTDVSGTGFLEGQTGDGGGVSAGSLRSEPILFGTVMTKDPVSSLWLPYFDVDAVDGLQYPRGILLVEIGASTFLGPEDIKDIPILIKGDYDFNQMVFENNVTITDIIDTKNVQVGNFLNEVGLYYIETVNTEEYQPLV